MSLLRTGLVLGVLFYALPTDPEKQQALIHSASETVVWGATYCQREPETCREAGVAWTTVVEKTKFGLALASDLATKWSEHRQAAASQPPARTDLTINDALAQSPDEPADPPAVATDGDQQPVKG